MAVAGSSSVSKFSLGHILDGDDDEGSSLRVNSNSSRHETASGRPSAGRGGRRRAMTAEEKRVARTCIVDGCANYIVHRKRCFRHGGGKTCSVEGCNTSAKQRGLCWRHGGSILCSIDGCTRGVKSRGLCWTHGGGNKKVKTEHSPESDDGSSTASEAPEPQSKRGAAAAAGSGKQKLTAAARPCLFDGCTEASQDNTTGDSKSTGFCALHAAEVTQENYVFEL